MKTDGNLTNEANQPEWSNLMNSKLIATLKSYWGGNLIPIFLTKIEWMDKSTGEQRHAFAYSSNPRQTVSNVGPSSVSCTLTVQGQSSNTENNITLWCDAMDEEMFNLYIAEGYGDATYNLDTNSIEYPTQEATQSNEAYQTA